MLSHRSHDIHNEYIPRLCPAIRDYKILAIYVMSVNFEVKLRLGNDYLFQFAFGDTTYAVGSEIGISCLNTSETTQVFVALLLPFSYQVGVSNGFLQAVIIQFCRYGGFSN